MNGPSFECTVSLRVCTLCLQSSQCCKKLPFLLRAKRISGLPLLSLGPDDHDPFDEDLEAGIEREGTCKIDRSLPRIAGLQLLQLLSKDAACHVNPGFETLRPEPGDVELRSVGFRV